MPEIWVGLEFELSVLRVLNIRDCTLQSLNVSKPTALKTMLELKIIGLVDKSEDVYDENVNNKVRHIYLNKERYSWFLSDDFKKLREGFIPLDYSKTITTSPSNDTHDDDLTEDESREEEANDISSRLLPAPLYRIGLDAFTKEKT